MGIDGELVRSLPLGPSVRYAAELVGGMDELLSPEALRPTDVTDVFVSVGPGSFTGLRVGITAARTFAQMIPSLQLIAVPTPLAIAENVSQMDWKHLGVLLAAKEKIVHATLLKRGAVAEFHSQLASIEELFPETPGDCGLGGWARPLVLTGEALGFFRDTEWPEDVRVVDDSLWLPTAEGVWRAGWRLAEEGKGITAWSNLLPVYARRPEAVRLWEARHGT